MDLHWEQEIVLSTLAWFHFPFVQLSPERMNVCLSVFLFAVLDRSLVASCKDSIGWMFSKLDTNSDLYLDQAELAAINLDKYEVCIRPFFNSCDSYRDGKVSTAEWCLCFWRESEYSEEDVEFMSTGVRRSTCQCADIFPLAHAFKLEGSLLALSCLSGVATSVLCAGPSLFVFLLNLLFPYGVKRSQQGAKNIPAAC